MTTVGGPNGRGPRFLEPAEPPIATPLIAHVFAFERFHRYAMKTERRLFLSQSVKDNYTLSNKSGFVY